MGVMYSNVFWVNQKPLAQNEKKIFDLYIMRHWMFLLLNNGFLLEIQRTIDYLILLKHTYRTDYTDTFNFLD